MARATSAGWAYSYANRVGGQLHVSVHLPNFEATDTEGARVKIVNGTRTKVAPATISKLEHGVFLEATFPPGKLANGPWQVQISPKAGERFETSNCRVCVCDPNPISLLVGRLGNSYEPAPVHTLTKRQRTAKSLGRLVDSALQELPPEQATKARSSLRRVARKVVPS